MSTLLVSTSPPLAVYFLDKSMVKDFNTLTKVDLWSEYTNGDYRAPLIVHLLVNGDLTQLESLNARGLLPDINASVDQKMQVLAAAAGSGKVDYVRKVLAHMETNLQTLCKDFRNSDWLRLRKIVSNNPDLLPLLADFPQNLKEEPSKWYQGDIPLWLFVSYVGIMWGLAERRS